MFCKDAKPKPSSKWKHTLLPRVAAYYTTSAQAARQEAIGGFCFRFNDEQLEALVHCYAHAIAACGYFP